MPKDPFKTKTNKTRENACVSFFFIRVYIFIFFVVVRVYKNRTIFCFGVRLDAETHSNIARAPSQAQYPVRRGVQKPVHRAVRGFRQIVEACLGFHWVCVCILCFSFNGVTVLVTRSARKYCKTGATLGRGGTQAYQAPSRGLNK